MVLFKTLLTGIVFILTCQYAKAQELYSPFNGGMVEVEGNGYVHIFSVATDQEGACYFVGYDNGVELSEQTNILVGKLLLDGSFDSTFGENGMVNLGFGEDSFEGGFDIAFQADGKILVSYFVNPGGNLNYSVLRLLPDGTLDLTYNGTGLGEMLPIETPQYVELCPIVIEADGKSIHQFVSAAPGLGLQLNIVRRNTDGTIDTDFATGGRQTINFADQAQTDEGGEMAVLANGNIAIAGTRNYIEDFVPHADMGLAILTADGTFDSAFSADGLNTYDIGTDSRFDKAHSILTMEDGGLLMLGEVNIPGLSGHLVALMKLNSDGIIEPSFGNNGVVELDASIELLGSTDARAGVTQPNGNFLIMARGDEPAAGNFSLFSIDPDGTLDTSFGIDGFFNFSDTIQPIIANDMAVSPDFNYVYTTGTRQSTDLAGYVFCVGLNASPTGVTDPDPERLLKLYPNPTADVVQFNATVANEVYFLTTLDGKLISQGKTNLGTNQLDLSPFENGLYLIEVGGFVGKVVKR